MINKIVRDSRGFLWFCTAEGLSRFDGYTFTNYTTNQGLPHQNITDFLETRSGEFWVGTNAGLVRFNPKGTQTNRVIAVNEHVQPEPMFSVVLPHDEDRYSKVVNVVLESRDGTIWCGTMRHLYRLERTAGHFELVREDLKNSNTQPEPIHILDLLEDRHGSLWIASFDWLCRRWPDGSSACYNQHNGLPDSNFHDLMEDREGRLWAATRRTGFFSFTADETYASPVVVRKYSDHEGLGTVWVSQLFEASDHRFWVATDRGLAEFFPNAGEREPKFKTYGQRNGLIYYGLNTLTEDSGGNLWLGSDLGAMKLARDGFISYGEQDGVSSVFAVFGDRTGRPCFRGSLFGDKHVTVFEGARPDLLRPVENLHTRYGQFDGQSFTWLKPDGLSTGQLGWVGEMVTLQARNGEWWLGTGDGLYRYPPSDNFAQLKHARPLTVYTTKDGLTAQQVFRLFEDSRGDVWVSAIQPNGLARWQRAGEIWQDLSNAFSLPRTQDDLARSLGEDQKGNVWVGFSTGIARYRDGIFTFFKAGDTLPPGGIQNIYSDRAGRLWLASSQSGLIRVDDPGADHPVFKAYTIAQGLSSNTAEGITEDLYGYIYVGTGRGLDRIDPATGHVKHFTTADGLAPGRIIDGFLAPDGTLWFGTANGMSRLAPVKDVKPGAPPPILIMDLSVAGKRQSVSAYGETQVMLRDLPPGENQLQVNFVGLSFAPGEVLRYQYKLEGSDKDWSALTEQRSVNYANLAAGQYKFFVRAVNSDGVISPQPASVVFTILPPIWKRWWFLTLAILAISVAAYALYRFRVARLLEVANMRTRIATDLHDDIGANLTKIAILSEVVRQQSGNGNAERDAPLSSIARISRESVAAMGDIVWAINPQRDNLLDLVRRMRQHAEDVCLAQNIDLIFRAPESANRLRLDVNVRRDLYLIFKEAVNNAVRHSQCRRLETDIGEEDGILALTLRDDGKGFDLEREVSGNGLTNMRRRVETHSGKIAIESHAGAGTIIRVRLPHTPSRWIFPTQTRR